MNTRRLLAVLLCLFAAPAGAAGTAKPYPPPGSPDTGAACQRRDAPPWMGFLCSFMTVDLWRAAGRPTFTAPDGSHWQPWYYGDVADRGNNLLYEGFPYRPRREGLLEAMLKTDTLPDEYDPAYVQRFWSLFRYAPWSVHFAHQAGCGDGRLAAPRDFVAPRREGDRFARTALLGLGWGQLAEDDADPTQGFTAAAMPAFMGVAEVGTMIDAGLRGHNGKEQHLRHVINAMAAGAGDWHPDYARDGEVWLVPTDGTGKRVDDLDAAAAYVAKTGVLLTNGGGQSWRRGFQLAKIPARSGKRPLVYIYFAQDALYPANGSPVYRRRLRYLVDRAARLVEPGRPGFTLVSMGRSAPVAMQAARRHARINQVIIDPVVGPGGAREYRDTLREEGRRIKVVASGGDPAALIGASISPDAKSRLCVGGHSTGGAVMRALTHLGTPDHGSVTGR